MAKKDEPKKPIPANPDELAEKIVNTTPKQLREYRRRLAASNEDPEKKGREC